MPDLRLKFGSDTNQQMFEMWLESRGLAYRRDGYATVLASELMPDEMEVLADHGGEAEDDGSGGS